MRLGDHSHGTYQGQHDGHNSGTSGVNHDNERDFWRDEPTSRIGRVRHAGERPSTERERRHGDTPPRGLPRLQPALPLAARQPRGAALQLVPSGQPHGAPVTADPFEPFEPLESLESDTDLDPRPMPSFRVDRLITGEVPLTVVDGRLAPAPQPGRADPFLVRIGLMLAFGMIAIVLVWATRSASADEPAPVPDSTPTQVEVAPADVELGPSRRVSSTSAAPAGLIAGKACSAGTYTVGRGDGWIAIAKKVGVTTKQLLAANGATARTVIHPGRTVCLPAGASAPASSTAPAAAPSSKSTVTPKLPATPAATPSTTVVVKTYTAAEVEAIIRQAWPDDLEDEALRIATRESNLKPGAKNSCCFGLFQIYFNVHKSWLQNVGVTSSGQLLDPTVNANAAYALYQRAGGFGPWN